MGDPYDHLLAAAYQQGMLEGFGDLHLKNGIPVLYLDGVRVMFTHKRCHPLFVLDSVEYLNPNLLIEEDNEQQEQV